MLFLSAALLLSRNFDLIFLPISVFGLYVSVPRSLVPRSIQFIPDLSALLEVCKLDFRSRTDALWVFDSDLFPFAVLPFFTFHLLCTHCRVPYLPCLLLSSTLLRSSVGLENGIFAPIFIVRGVVTRCANLCILLIGRFYRTSVCIREGRFGTAH